MRALSSICVCLGLALTATGPLLAADRDSDGLLDKHEEVLGTDPDQPDRFETIVKEGLESAERRAQAGYDGTKDILTVEFCHAGGDRYLWRATFAEAPRLKDTVFHLYVDGDADPMTGRKGVGCEYMLTVAKGNGTSGFYDRDGNRGGGPAVTYVVEGKRLIMSADVDLGRDEKGIRYGLRVLCHTAVPRPPMTDEASNTVYSGLRVVSRKKIKRLIDRTESEGVEGTFGINIVRKTLKRDDVAVVPYDKLEMDGFQVDLFTYRRFGHVRRQRLGGKVWTAAPKAGSYHVGFLMFDDASDERFAFRIDGKLKGVVVANCDNNRWWVHWLKEPYAFRGGERVELMGFGTGGKHGVCNILFLPKPPTPRRLQYAVENMAFFTPIGQDGRVTLSWTTSWPGPTRFEYGETTAYGKIATADKHLLVHRAALEGLDPATEYHGRAVGTKKDGTVYHGADIVFRAKAKTPPATVEGVRSVQLTVKNPHEAAAARWPVTTGVPFPEGLLGDSAHVRLTRGGEEVSAQIATTAQWRDGSVKWALMSFLADVGARAEAQYRIQFGRSVRRATVPAELSVVRNPDGIEIDTGALRVRIDRQGQVVLPSGKACRTTMAAADGKIYSSGQDEAELTIEEAGPIRAVVKTVADLVAEDGAKSFRIEKRVVAYRGAKSLQVSHTFVVDRPERFTEIESMHYDVPATAKAWRVPLEDEDALRLDASAPLLRQRFDRELVVAAVGKETPTAGRITGSAIGAGGCAVAVRDFWQNYPKGFSLANDGLRIGLCPDFEAGLYDKFPFEKEGHHLYYYLLNGRYKFKRGMAKTHDIFLCFAPDVEREAQCELFQRRLLGTVDPKWVCASRTFYDVAPRDLSRSKAYEEAIDNNLKRYVATRERLHDYGLMNFGDWYGERGTNWGNIEYDTQHAFLLEYIRSGNPDAFFLADQTELHNRDIDTVQWSADPNEVGAVYVHQMCHVGWYYDRPVPGFLGYPRGGYTVSHAWSEGHFNHYFVTGDRRSYETGKAVTDFFIRKELSRPYYFLSCRTPGWQLMQTAIAYASTNDPYYLNASRIIVDRVLETQDVEPRELPEYQKEPGRTHHAGGWSHMMLPGHCHCEPRHQGNAGFMVAVLLSGLKYFHDVTGDPQVKESIIRGAHYLLDDTYSDETHGFRYTSCPSTNYGRGAAPLMVEGVARAYLWTREERFKRVLTEALPLSAGGSGYGKGFSMYYRVGPRVLADLIASGLTLNERFKPKMRPFKKPEWMAKLGPDRLIVVQAEAFKSEGVGKCQIRSDRDATWGTMITYWHADIGHWIEWAFDVPADGPYVIRFRYATSCEKTKRELQIDGRVPCPSAKSIAFEDTGGFGQHARNWKYLSLTDEKGQDVSIGLTKGTHRIRMTNLNDGLGLDFIALVRAPEKQQ